MDQQKHRVTWGKVKRILSYLRPYWWLEGEILVCMCISVGLSLVDPLVLKILIDRVLIGNDFGLLHILMIALVCLYLVRSGFMVITAYLFNFAGQRILFDIRSRLFQHLEKLDMGFHNRTKTGEMLSRLHSDVESLQSIMTTTFVDLITDFLTVLAILALLFYFDWRLTLVSLTVFPFLFVSITYFGRKIRMKSRLVREQVANILHFFQETITGMKLVQAFVREKYEARRFLRKGKKMINLRIDLGIFGSLTASAAAFFGALGPALVLYYGGYRVMTGALTLGGLIAFYTYIGKLLSPVSRLAQMNVAIQTAMASVDRIFEFMDVEPQIRDQADAVVPKTIRGDVSFDDVSFRYQLGEPVLEDVSFAVRRGERVAIVGPTGVGKTTIIDLICRFYDPSSGAIKLDGIDTRQIKLSTLRGLIGIVSQETFLFNASIKENLRYGKLRATEEEIIEAAKRANIHDFIVGLTKGYETQAGDRGLRLSGGERQRLAIARAILKDPKILILDEATSALDSQSEALIQQALEPLMRDRTTITIAHRLSTVVDSDQILVLSNGRITERGTHRELLERDGLYKALWEEQVKKRPGWG